MPYMVSFGRRIPWSTVLKAFLRSRNTFMLILRRGAHPENHWGVVNLLGTEF